MATLSKTDEELWPRAASACYNYSFRHHTASEGSVPGVVKSGIAFGRITAEEFAS
jgi:hypothetical protein